MSIPNNLQRTKSVALIVPAVIDGTSTNSVVIDRKGFNSAYIDLSYSACVGGGAPSSATLAFKIYSNTIDATTGSPVLLDTFETVLNILLAGFKSYAVDLTNASRYVYVNFDSTLGGGTTPSNIVSCTAVLGDASVRPADGVVTVYGR